MKKTLVLVSILFLSSSLIAQPFTKADTLRGSNGPGRLWWDATHYALELTFDIEGESIKGKNTISFQQLTLDHVNYFQIDLQEPLAIDSIILRSPKKNNSRKNRSAEKLVFTRLGNAYFVHFNKNSLSELGLYQIGKLEVYYHGVPKKAARAPWDGGLVWKKDKEGNPWISVACQGLGASVWYPCKDYQGDEPDSAFVSLNVPDTLTAISNGTLVDIQSAKNNRSVYQWKVVNPINNYDISFYIGKYDHFQEIFEGEKGPLIMDFWPLKYNLNKAKTQFKEAGRMLQAFEYWFGPYPFYEDGYKLVEAPYLGMEHQSGIAYGNKYANGYLGTDLSGTGVGLKWDFIIVHESGHEWFGNNITAIDVADMWVHESFTNYSETLFTEYYFGMNSANQYVIGTRKKIANDIPIIGVYGVNKEGSGDMYYKGGNMIHMIRQIINDDEKFRGILRGLNRVFYHQTVTTQQVEEYISTQAGIDFSKFFDQYLRDIRIPVLEYKKEGDQWYCRWTNCVKGFEMPIQIKDAADNSLFIHPTEQWTKIEASIQQLRVDENFYIHTKYEN